MPITLARPTDPYADDAVKPKPPLATPKPTAAGGTLGLAPQPLAPSGAAAPMGAGIAPPVPMTPPGIALAPPSTMLSDRATGIAETGPNTILTTHSIPSGGTGGTGTTPQTDTSGVVTEGHLPITLAPPVVPPPRVAPADGPMPVAEPVSRRLALAKEAWDTFARGTEPQYGADLRLATQQAAGRGQVGSGQLRTSYGDLATNRALQLDTKRDELINSALTGTIGDEQEAARLQFAKDQVTEQARQFGASQAQQLELAKLADKTQNRQIDLSTQQGKLTLMLELARIMGGPTGSVDPAFIRAIAEALGFAAPPIDQNPGHTNVPPGAEPQDRPRT